MTTVEHITQATNIGSPKSASTLLSNVAATSVDTVESVDQFAATVENSVQPELRVDSPWSFQVDAAETSDAALGIDGLSAHFNGELGALVATPTETAATASLAIEKSDTLSINSLLVQDTEFQPYAEGIPGIQLVQYNGVGLSVQSADADISFPNSGEALPSSGITDQLLFADAAAALADGTFGEAQAARLIHVAQLDAFEASITNPQTAATASTQGQIQLPSSFSAEAKIQDQPLYQAPVPTAVAAQLASLAATPAAAPIVIGPDGQPVLSGAASPNTAGLPTLPNTSATPTSSLAPSLTAATTQPTANLQTVRTEGEQTLQTTDKLAETVGQKSMAENATEAARIKSENNAAEGHLVQNGQKQNVAAASQSVQAANTNANKSNAASKPTQAAIQANKSGGLLSVPNNNAAPLPGAAATDIAPDSKDYVQPAMVRQEPLPAPVRMNAPVSWTPERLAGLSDGALPSDTIAGGLSSLRGEPSFMNSMGLMGGKPSAALGGQIAKQVNLQVTRAVKNGRNEFTMRLNPSELGSVRVKMSFHESGSVSARFLVERPETLELLQREVRGMERAVEAGGHKVDAQGLSFNLDSNDDQGAGKAFADAAREDQLKDKIENSGSSDQDDTAHSENQFNDQTDLATLEEILSRVSPETGLDVRV